MYQIATVTSKRQLTIPAAMFQELGWSSGQRLVVSQYKKGELTLKSAQDLVEELGGSVKVPKKFEGLLVDEVIRRAKSEYFQKKIR